MALLRDACSQQAGLCASSIVGAHTPACELQAYLKSVTLGPSLLGKTIRRRTKCWGHRSSLSFAFIFWEAMFFALVLNNRSCAV